MNFKIILFSSVVLFVFVGCGLDNDKKEIVDL